MKKASKRLLVSHECPKALFVDSRTFNDFDYCLVHMCEKDPEYFYFYVEQAARGRTVFLDNSVFELGKPVPPEFLLQYAKWIKPTHIIPPDVLHDGPATVMNIASFIVKMKEEGFKNLKVIAVAQGKTEVEYVECYKALARMPEVSIIAFPYDLLFYDHELIPKYGKVVMRFVEARARLIDKLIDLGTIDRHRGHHLLGCSDPVEFKHYRKLPRYDFLTSVDTSSPILHGWHGMKITYKDGLKGQKKPNLLADNLDIKLTPAQRKCIMYNIKVFKKLVAQEG